MFKCLSPAPLGFTATPNELIEPALSHGFKSLELDVVAFAAQVEREGLATARRLLDSAKLKQGFFRLPFEVEADDDAYRAGLDALKNHGRLAADLGCTRAVTVLAPAGDERPIHQNFDFHRRRLDEIAQALDGFGIRFGVGFCATAERREGHAFEFIRAFDTLNMLLGMVGAKNVGLAVDLYELWACGSSFEGVRRTGRSVTALFVADAPADAAPARAAQSGRLLPGEGGAIDAAAVLTALAESGYDGPVVPLPHPTRFAGVGRNAVFKTVGEKLDQAWKAAGLSPAGKLSPVKR